MINDVTLCGGLDEAALPNLKKSRASYGTASYSKMDRPAGYGVP